MEIDHASADDGRDCRAMHRATVEGRVATLRLRATHVEDPLEIRIEKRYIRVRVLFQRATIREPEDPRRVRRAHLNDALQVDQSRVYEIERQPDRGFESRDPKRRLIKFKALLVE